MNINEQKLAEAVNRLREGDSYATLVSKDDVLEKMAVDDFGTNLIVALFEGDDASALFENEFDRVARSLLTEALRTKKEQQAGLM